MDQGETTLHMPVKKKILEDAKIAGRRIDLLLDRIAVTEHPTRIARTTNARWTSFCMHLGLVPSRNKHAKISPRELGGVDYRTAREICVSEGDGVQEAPLVEPPTRCQTERPEDLPSGREPWNEKSKGTGAAVG